MEQSQEERERNASQFLHFLSELYLCTHNSVEAYSSVDWYMQGFLDLITVREQQAGFFVCQSNFPICDECQHGRSYLASREECERLSMAECEEEWTSARQYGISLPSCTDLPEELIGEDSRYGNSASTLLRCKPHCFCLCICFGCRNYIAWEIKTYVQWSNQGRAATNTQIDWMVVIGLMYTFKV